MAELVPAFLLYLTLRGQATTLNHNTPDLNYRTYYYTADMHRTQGFLGILAKGLPASLG